MRSFQDKVLAELERRAVTYTDVEVVQVQKYSNTGKVLAQRGFTTLAHAEYAFQSGHNSVLFNGAQLGDRSTPKLSFLFKENEDTKIAEMFASWDQILRDGLAVPR